MTYFQIRTLETPAAKFRRSSATLDPFSSSANAPPVGTPFRFLGRLLLARLRFRCSFASSANGTFGIQANNNGNIKKKRKDGKRKWRRECQTGDKKNAGAEVGRRGRLRVRRHFKTLTPSIAVLIFVPGVIVFWRFLALGSRVSTSPEKLSISVAFSSHLATRIPPINSLIFPICAGLAAINVRT